MNKNVCFFTQQRLKQETRFTYEQQIFETYILIIELKIKKKKQNQCH